MCLPLNPPSVENLRIDPDRVLQPGPQKSPQGPTSDQQGRGLQSSSAWGEGEITEGQVSLTASTSAVRHARRRNQEAGVRAPWEGTASRRATPSRGPEEPTSYFTTLLGAAGGRLQAGRAGPVREHPSPSTALHRKVGATWPGCFPRRQDGGR